LATGDTHGEIFFWYIDSARYMKRYKIPVTTTTASATTTTTSAASTVFLTQSVPTTTTTTTTSTSSSSSAEQGKEGKDATRAGVSCLEFVQFTETLVLLCVGTTDGWIHFLDVQASTFISSLSFKATPEAVRDIAIGTDPTAEDRLVFCVIDCEKDCVLYDVSLLQGGLHKLKRKLRDRKTARSTSVRRPFEELRRWQPHGENVITSMKFIDTVSCFVTSSDVGEVKLWTANGTYLADIGQTTAWPIEDPRSGGKKQKTNIYDDSDEDANESIDVAVQETKVQRYIDTHPMSPQLLLTPASTRELHNVAYRSKYIEPVEDVLPEHLKDTNLYAVLQREERLALDAHHHQHASIGASTGASSGSSRRAQRRSIASSTSSSTRN
jgi:WD40 repeat protein